MISIIDYGVGNLGSIKNMLEYLGIKSQIISTIPELEKATKIILPGVGSWDSCISKLTASELLSTLNKRVVTDRVPLLGICLGMQLFFDSSEEGTLPGLGWVAGHIKKFDFSLNKYSQNKLRIPHMGWNIVQANEESPLTNQFDGEIRFYFAHSYHAVVDNEVDSLMTCNYGYDFTCAVHKGNIWGVQFHPEKSHKFGMTLMKQFSEL